MKVEHFAQGVMAVSNSETDAKVGGDVAVLVEGKDLRGATLTVVLEDVTLVDVASTTVARYERQGVDADIGVQLILPFEIEFERTSARLGLRALLDADGDGRASRGDYVSVQSYPVDGQAEISRVRMSLRRIP
jgi:uncharacterized lipoprotein YbaY